MAPRLTCAIAVLATAACAAGLFARGLYRDDTLLREGWIANDLVTLVVAVPLLLYARDQRVRLGVLHFFSYNYAFYAFGAALNALLPVYIAIVALSLWGFALGLRELRPVATRGGRGVAAWMVFVALGLTVTWLAQWAVALLRATPPTRFDLTPEFIRVVATIDLTWMVSLLVPSAILLYRRRPIGYALAVVMNVSGALYMAVLAAATIAQVRAGLAGAWAMIGLWATLGVGCAIAAAKLRRTAASPLALQSRTAGEGGQRCLGNVADDGQRRIRKLGVRCDVANARNNAVRRSPYAG